jgi:hypothetical protein
MAETATTTADTKEAEIGPMENFLKNNIKTVDRDLPKLLAAIKDKFKKRKWPQKDNKKSFKCLDLLLGILGGDNKKDVLMDYLNTATRKSMKESIKKNDPDAYDVKANIKLMLEDCRKQTNASQTDPIVNSVRINLLKLLNGAKGQGRKKLLEDGFAFGTSTWAKAYDDVIENGMAVYKQPISVQGRSSVSVNLKSKIHDHVMNSENDYIKVLPAGDKTTKGAVALNCGIREIYNAFSQKNELGYDSFRKLVSGKKDSATPKLRKWLHETDHCQICPQRETAISAMQVLVSTASSKSSLSSLREIFDNVVAVSEEALDPHVGRTELAELESFIAEVALHTSASEVTIKKHMKDICDLGFHVYCKRKVLGAFKKFRDEPMDTETLGLIFDWKENAKRGRGPKEDASVVHNIEATAVFGVYVCFFSAEHKETSKVYVPIFTDVLDKTAEAAVELIKFVFEELNKLEWFAPCWNKSKKFNVLLMLAATFEAKCFFITCLSGL